MRNLLILLIGGFLLALSANASRALSGAQELQSSSKAERELLKGRQKEERKAFQQGQRYKKQTVKQVETPPAVRLQEKHLMQREARELRRRQHDELQDLKDRQKLVKEGQDQL